MKIPVNNIAACVLSLMTLALSGAAYTYAAETSGTITAQSSKSRSSLSGTLSTNAPEITADAASAEETATASRASRSGIRRVPTTGSSETQSQSGNGSIMLSDGSITSATELNGTGGGFDPELEEFLSGQTDDGVLSPEDVIAYNSSQNPLLNNTDLTASVSDSGVSVGKIWTAVILGLLLMGLSGYAVYTLAGYKRENEL